MVVYKVDYYYIDDDWSDSVAEKLFASPEKASKLFERIASDEDIARVRLIVLEDRDGDLVETSKTERWPHHEAYKRERQAEMEERLACKAADEADCLEAMLLGIRLRY